MRLGAFPAQASVGLGRPLGSVVRSYFFACYICSYVCIACCILISLVDVGRCCCAVSHVHWQSVNVACPCLISLQRLCVVSWGGCGSLPFVSSVSCVDVVSGCKEWAGSRLIYKSACCQAWCEEPRCSGTFVYTLSLCVCVDFCCGSSQQEFQAFWTHTFFLPQYKLEESRSGSACTPLLAISWGISIERRRNVDMCIREIYVRFTWLKLRSMQARQRRPAGRDPAFAALRV